MLNNHRHCLLAHSAVINTLPVAAKLLLTDPPLLCTSALAAAMLFSMPTHACPARINSSGGARAKEVHEGSNCYTEPQQ